MRFLSKLIALSCAACCTPMALAQNFPDRPLKVLTGNPGGGSDLMARMIATGLSTNLGQPATVINRSGSQYIVVTEAMRSAPDGYTVLALGANQFWLSPFLRDDVPYDPIKDFEPLMLTATSPNMVVVNANIPATNLRELIALAKSKPGKLNLGIGNYGSSPHLAAELFKAMSNTYILTIPYKGTGQAMTGLLAGQVDVMFPTVSSGMPGVKAGKLRALAVTTEKPTALAPGVPTVAATLRGYSSNVDYAAFVPAKTPAAIITVLNQAIAKYLQSDEIKQKIFNSGLEVVASSPQGLAATMKQDRDLMSKVIRERGLKTQ